MQPELFQGRGVFLKLADFDKHILKTQEKKASQGKTLENVPRDTLKTIF